MIRIWTNISVENGLLTVAVQLWIPPVLAKLIWCIQESLAWAKTICPTIMVVLVMADPPRKSLTTSLAASNPVVL